MFRNSFVFTWGGGRGATLENRSILERKSPETRVACVLFHFFGAKHVLNQQEVRKSLIRRMLLLAR